MSTRIHRPQIAKSSVSVFLCLFATLATIASLILTFVFTQYNTQAQDAQKTKLLSLAQIASSQVNKQTHASTQIPDDIPTTTSQQQTQILKNLIAELPQPTQISTIINRNGSYRFLFHTDNLTESRFLKQNHTPITSPSLEMLKSFQTNTNQVTNAPNRTSNGNWLTAYVPLSTDGKVVAVLALSQSVPAPQSTNLFSKAQLTVLIATLILCLGLAWLLTSLIAPISNCSNPQKSVPVFALQAALFIAVTTLAFQGSVGISEEFNLSTIQSQNVAKISILAETERALQNPENLTQAQIDSLAKKLTRNNLSDISLLFTRAIKSKSPNDVSELAKKVYESRQKIYNEFTGYINAGVQEVPQRVITLVISALIAIAAISSIKRVNAQQQEIQQSHSAIVQAQSQYATVVENLPVGLFTIANGQFSFVNTEWRNQVKLTHGEAQTEAFYQSIHKEDQEFTYTTLKEAEQTQSSFRIQYRIINDTTIHHMETRGIPIYDSEGNFTNLLCFTIDITNTVNANLSAQKAYAEVARKNELLSDALTELEENLENIVFSFIKAVEAKDPYTAGHSERVMKYSLMLGEAIGLGPYELRVLELGTLVHDVGKIGIPDAILTKPDRLTNEEYEIIKKHPEWGERIISNISMFKDCIPIVRGHHERLDGRGYPDGLKGEELSVLVRIAGIADIFDAMTSNRAYRKGIPVNEVLAHMEDIAQQGQIDLQLFSTFRQVINKNGIIAQSDTTTAPKTLKQAA